jgi:tRNA G18 (ribose-2'-O)-methylase SpoU
MQLTHYTSRFSIRTFPIVLVCDDITNSLNIGGLFRIADAFGIEKIIFCGDQISIDNKVKRTSRSTETVVPYTISKNIDSELECLKNSGFQLLGLEITTESQRLNEFKLDRSSPIVLIIGGENFGISESVLKLVDNQIHIEMFGQNSSMNVVQATGIALYEITRQIL